MSGNRCGLVALTLWLVLCLVLSFASAPADAQSLDVLQGKFAFNWHSNPDREKCIKVAGPLLAAFKSARYRCDLTVITNTSSGERARKCTERNDGKEYLIFDTMRACENERKDQASNE